MYNFETFKNNEKTTRGSCDATFTEKGEITVVRWNVNTVVTLLTNWDVLEASAYAKWF